MNQKTRALLQEAFQAPEPIRKKEFLKTCPPQPISHISFVLSQAGYIRKRILILIFIVLLIVLPGTVFLRQEILYILSAMAPILAMTLITESGRSESCGMSELELSTRFSLKNVVLARLILLGMFNFLLLFILIHVTALSRHISLVRTGVYILCPYMITAFLGLWITRRIRTKEATYICAGTGVLASLGVILLMNVSFDIYEGEYFIWWLLLLVPAVFGAIREGAQMLKQKEELEWNL